MYHTDVTSCVRLLNNINAYFLLGLPMAALSTIAFPFKLTLKEQAILTRIYLPWAVECSKSCIFLMNVYYEKILDRNVVELREEFGFVKPPRQSSAQM